MKHANLIRSLALGLTIAATAAPTAAAYVDMRAPDNRDAAQTSTAAPVDLRSPDARDAQTTPAAPVDLRSPDARDASSSSSGQVDLRSPDARDATTASAPEVTVVTAPEPSDNGLDWGGVGIGAAAVLGVMLLGLGTRLVATRRRRRTPVVTTG